MLPRRNAGINVGHGDHALVEDEEFEGEETPMIRKGGWAGVVQEIYFDEEREREREFLEALKPTRTTGEALAVGAWVIRTKRIRQRNIL